MIITSNGLYAHQAMHPSSNISRQYVVKCNKEVKLEHLKKMERGVYHEGRHLVPFKVQKIRGSTIKMTLKRGKKHEVRLIVAGCGLDVLELKRVSYGSLLLGKLPVGCFKTIDEATAFSILPSDNKQPLL